MTYSSVLVGVASIAAGTDDMAELGATSASAAIYRHPTIRSLAATAGPPASSPVHRNGPSPTSQHPARRRSGSRLTGGRRAGGQPAPRRKSPPRRSSPQRTDPGSSHHLVKEGVHAQIPTGGHHPSG